MELRDDLIELFDYDLWANRRWLPLCERPELKALMDHILTSQRIWLERISGQTVTAGSLEHWQVALCAGWKHHLAAADLETPVAYTNLRGEPYAESRRDIVRHVLNHGTYHRGQMRGLAEQFGIEEFPETDLILYVRER